MAFTNERRLSVTSTLSAGHRPRERRVDGATINPQSTWRKVRKRTMFVWGCLPDGVRLSQHSEPHLRAYHLKYPALNNHFRVGSQHLRDLLPGASTCIDRGSTWTVLGYRLHPVADVHFLANVFDMRADGFDADLQLVTNFLVNKARGQEVENLLLAG